MDSVAQRIALRGFIGALIGGVLGVMGAMFVLPLLIMSGAGWGYAVGGWPLARRGANASTAAFLAAGALAIPLTLLVFRVMPSHSMETAGIDLPLAFSLALAGLGAGMVGGFLFALTLGRGSLVRTGALVGGGSAFLTAFVTALVLMATADHTHTRDFFGDTSGIGVLFGVLVLTPPIAFALSAPLLSILYAREKDGPSEA